jgi:hypothetical protein
MPTSSEAVIFRGAKISASNSKNGWRVWLDPSDVRKERCVAFRGDKKTSWAAALDLVKREGGK